MTRRYVEVRFFLPFLLFPASKYPTEDYDREAEEVHKSRGNTYERSRVIKELFMRVDKVRLLREWTKSDCYVVRITSHPELIRFFIDGHDIRSTALRHRREAGVLALQLSKESLRTFPGLFDRTQHKRHDLHRPEVPIGDVELR